MTLADYTVVITPDDGTWLAYVPAIEGLLALGSSPDEARHELAHVFVMIQEEFTEKACRSRQTFRSWNQLPSVSAVELQFLALMALLAPVRPTVS